MAAIFAEGPQVPAGFRFAINIDLVMFQVFAARYSQEAWNFNLSNTEGLDRPLLAVLPGAETTGQDIAVAVAYSELTNSTTFLLFGLPSAFEATLWNSSSVLPLPQPLSIVPTPTGLSLWTTDSNFDIILAGSPLSPKVTTSSNVGGKAFSILGAEDLLLVYAPTTSSFGLFGENWLTAGNKNGWQPLGQTFSLLAACPGLTAPQVTAVASLSETTVEAVVFYSCNLSIFILPLALSLEGPSSTMPVQGVLFDVGSHPRYTQPSV